MTAEPTPFLDAEPLAPPDSPARAPIKATRRAFVFGVRFGQAFKVAGFAGMLAWLATGRATWLDAGLFAAMYATTMAGITVGFHRLFAHRSFKARPALAAALAIAGTMAGQGSAPLWVSFHRRHHRFSDLAGDPHSPHWPHAGLPGFWHAQEGWILGFYPPPDWERFVPDLLDDPMHLALHRTMLAWVWVGVLGPTLIGAAAHGWAGAVGAFCFGGWGRMFVVERVVSLVNSWGHLFGRRPFATCDRSANNAWLAALTLGDGWHNNHHAFPASARHGLLPWQGDPGHALIRLAAALGLAHDVIVPDAEQVARKRA